jgi:predicted Zn finger-like uncharacterized protein
MILTCPSCSTRYQADSARFALPGRNVRCAKCGHVWFQTAPDVEPEPEPVLEPVLAAPPPEPVPSVPAADAPATLGSAIQPPQSQPEPQPVRKRARRPAKNGVLADAIAWAALIFLAVTIGWAAVQYRQTIVELWPGVAPLYEVLGMPVETEGIALIDIAYKHEVEDGQAVLSVTGKIVNVSDRELPVPIIRVMLSDEAQQEIYHWMFDAGVPSLEPGAERPFVTRLSSPPAEARNLNIRFAQAGEAE